MFLFCGRIDGWSIRRLFCVCPLTIALTRWSLGGCQLVTPRSISGWKFEKKQNISPLIIFRPSKYDERRLCIVIFRLLTIVFTLSTVFSLCTKNVNETKRKSYQNEGGCWITLEFQKKDKGGKTCFSPPTWNNLKEERDNLFLIPPFDDITLLVVVLRDSLRLLKEEEKKINGCGLKSDLPECFKHF